ncbi:hypothetical protein P4S54_15145 [Shewanella sp. PP-He15 brown]
MSNNQEWTISYRKLGVVIFAFSLGVITALLISNSQAPSITSFSTTELIGFVLSVILSGASIVLAISAIALGKSSEQSVIERSDESIRLQNEVFIRTTEALQRIEASTGVTEKRIEDIITGRVGDISQKIAGLASEGQLGTRQSKKELEDEIKSTLMSAIKGTKRTSELDDLDRRMREREESDNRYEENHRQLMEQIKSIPGLIVGKIGHGSPNKKGDDQIDCIFTLNSERIGVSTFRSSADQQVLEDYFRGVANQIESNNFSRIVAFAFDLKDFEKKANEILKPYKDNLKEKIFFKQIDSNNIDKEVLLNLISNKSIQSTAEAADD